MHVSPSTASGTAVDFSRAARVLSSEARRRGLVVPGFRCPPRVVGVHRTLRRQPNGVVIAVQVRGRPWFVVVADMIEGVVVANRIPPARAFRLRTDLWAALGFEAGSAATRVA